MLRDRCPPTARNSPGSSNSRRGFKCPAEPASRVAYRWIHARPDAMAEAARDASLPTVMFQVEIQASLFGPRHTTSRLQADFARSASPRSSAFPRGAEARSRPSLSGVEHGARARFNYPEVQCPENKLLLTNPLAPTIRKATRRAATERWRSLLIWLTSGFLSLT